MSLTRTLTTGLIMGTGTVEGSGYPGMRCWLQGRYKTWAPGASLGRMTAYCEGQGQVEGGQAIAPFDGREVRQANSGRATRCVDEGHRWCNPRYSFRDQGLALIGPGIKNLLRYWRYFGVTSDVLKGVLCKRRGKWVCGFFGFGCVASPELMEPDLRSAAGYLGRRDPGGVIFWME